MNRAVKVMTSIALLTVVTALGTYVMLHPHIKPVVVTAPLLPNVVFMDGGFFPALGSTYHESFPVGGIESYASSTLGVVLDYTEDYLLFTSAHGTNTDAYESITLMPATSTEWTIAAVRDGHGGWGVASIDWSRILPEALGRLRYDSCVACST